MNEYVLPEKANEKLQKIHRREQIALQQLENCEILEAEDRELSDHVQSRWYRAPEICILHKRYDQAIDMWGIGCVLAELLNQLGTIKKKKTQRYGQKMRVLFPSDSCFPLSPSHDKAE